MESSLSQHWAKKMFFKVLEQMQECSLEIICDGETHRFGDPENTLRATIAVHNERFFRCAVLNGDIGIGESYMDGEWSTPDLVAVVRAGVRNVASLMNSNAVVSLVPRIADWIAHRRQPNTVRGSQKNIAYHYDLGNDFYRLFLDDSLTYSCAYYQAPEDSLEQAQRQKLDLICRKLQLNSNDHILEIGTGWGAFAAYAATHYGCQVTTTTISREQHAYALQLFQPLLDRGAKIELLFEDYRNLSGQFDKIVSIEMFEAVGYRFYDTFFSTCDRLLKPDGMMLLQAITLKEQEFPCYLRRSDWIRKHIFPGSELTSVSEVMRSLARSTQLQMFHLEDIGWHYAQTVGEWRNRLLSHLDGARKLGYDERFLRMWDYYLAYCDGAFRERYIGDVQLLLAKVGVDKQLLNDPCARQSSNSTSVTV
jgi:cyclopropane-fatty-acyl-phospholipid synthase